MAAVILVHIALAFYPYYKYVLRNTTNVSNVYHDLCTKVNFGLTDALAITIKELRVMFISTVVCDGELLGGRSLVTQLVGGKQFTA